MRKKSFSGKNVKVFIGTFPIALAKVEDAVTIAQAEGDFLDPAIDMDGDGAHVENVDVHGEITLKVDPSSTATIQFLQAFRDAKQAAPEMSGRDMTTKNKAFNCRNVALSVYPNWQGGTRPQILEYKFMYINGEGRQDGPKVLPI